MRRRGFLNQEDKDPEFVHYCTIAAGYLNEQKSWLSMKPLKTWRSLFRKRNSFCDGGIYGCKMKQMPFFCILCIVTLFIVYRTTTYQYQDTTIEERLRSFEAVKEVDVSSQNLNGLPQGIIQAKSDLELRPLWSTSSSRSKVNDYRNHSLLAISVGIKQKRNVDSIVRKFLSGNFSIILFHYDGKVDEWWDLKWSSKAIHIVGQNQTKWWFAKRFLHPAVVSVYDFIFLWDEDLGVEHFSPKRYLDIVKSEGLEISQPALDPNSTDIHHRITVRARTKKIHRRVYDMRGTLKCTDNSDGPPCTGFVEGMAPVFSRAAWNCAWHLIQNDLIHGWGMDMKLGYCAQGDRTKKVGIVDSEYIVHKGIQTLGGGASSDKNKRWKSTSDVRTEIRRQSTWELRMFKERWNKAIAEDKYWVDPFKRETDRDGRRVL